MKENATSLPSSVAFNGRSSVIATVSSPVTAHADIKLDNLLFGEQYASDDFSHVVVPGVTRSEHIQPKFASHPTGSRVYPHIYDDSLGSGLAMSLVEKAQGQIAQAIEFFSDGDLQSLSAALSNAALVLATAHEHTNFNDSFGALISHLRRGLLLLSPADVQLAQLMSVGKALNLLHEHPMMTLDQATDEVEALEKAGVHGEHQAIELFLQSLIDVAGDGHAHGLQQTLFEGVK